MINIKRKNGKKHVFLSLRLRKNRSEIALPVLGLSWSLEMLHNI
jgi:hypothetical protein